MCNSECNVLTSSSSDEDSENRDKKDDERVRQADAKEDIIKFVSERVVPMLGEAMRDLCVFIVFLLILSRFNNGSGSASKKLLKTVGLAEAEVSAVPQAAAPAGLPTRNYHPSDKSFFADLGPTFVDDYPSGKVYQAFTEADIHQNAFIMYYAPWDGDCVYARKVLNEVSKIIYLAQETVESKEVYIGAINCWLPGSDCVNEFYAKSQRKSRSIHQLFPVFVFYPNDREGIQYTGPITTSDILEFITLVTNPLKHLVTMEDVASMRMNHGGTLLVGYFPNLYQNQVSYRGYEALLSVSYRLLEADPSRSVYGGVGVISSPELAFQLQLNATALPIKLILWNGTSISYPRKNISGSLRDKLFSWARQTVHNSTFLTRWVGTTGSKSLFLSDKLLRNEGNSLVVFIRRANRFVIFLLF